MRRPLHGVRKLFPQPVDIDQSIRGEAEGGGSRVASFGLRCQLRSAGIITDRTARDAVLNSTYLIIAELKTTPLQSVDPDRLECSCQWRIPSLNRLDVEIVCSPHMLTESGY